MDGEFPRDFFKSARVALKLSNLRLAELAQISPATLSHIESTDRHVGTRTIEKVRKALEEQGVIFFWPNDEHGPGFKIKKATYLALSRSSKE
ncbi:helix-turn-helix domain-containing protein [Pseudorhizobium marinum]|uniref:helix-turn-helix domain-containing protein n=1 Tax=Pseudorhizobium marinum TaxID=1496690 RepID=UPI00049560F8|nr:helix-turn-helix transcriptional regulator [Pseudorhizobium marinum]